MLIKQADLKKIKSGDTTLLFRQWQKPRVKNGSIIHTSIGQVLIEEIKKVPINSITETEAGLAGYPKLASLIKAFSDTKDQIFKIRVVYHGADPRIKLREETIDSVEELRALKKKLSKMDRQGAWTLRTLLAIKQNPELESSELAKLLVVDQVWLKPNIRKLKNLGLTISHKVGYSISPRGLSLLNQITEL